MSADLTKPSPLAALTAALDGAKLSKRARASIEAAALAMARAERDRVEALDVPAECVEAVTRAAAYGARVGYLAAVRDCAQELQRHGGEAQEAATKALSEEFRAQIHAPLGVLARATVGAAQETEEAIREEMRPRPENRATFYGPNPLATMAQRARDAAGNASGIEVRDAGTTPADE